MKILQICNFSKGISGVWTRVLEESKQFVKKGHQVTVLSSNLSGKGEIVSKREEVLNGVNIKRLNVKRRMGYALWLEGIDGEIITLEPELIICHGYRKPYTHNAIKIAKIIDAKCFLITHAPFDLKRSLKLKLFVKLYDFFYKDILNKFDKVITISKWEIPYLLKLGCKKENIIHIPNGIPNEFFTPRKEGEGVYYMGRVCPRKNVEVLLKACKTINVNPTIIGPIEEGYKLDTEIKPPIYDLKEKIKEIDKYKVFVLPSKWEGMPQALIEAMARGKIVIASRIKGTKEFIESGENGFLFEMGNSFELRLLILSSLFHYSDQIMEEMKKEAIKTAEQFKLSNVMNKWEKLLVK